MLSYNNHSSRVRRWVLTHAQSQLRNRRFHSDMAASVPMVSTTERDASHQAKPPPYQIPTWYLAKPPTSAPSFHRQVGRTSCSASLRRRGWGNEILQLDYLTRCFANPAYRPAMCRVSISHVGFVELSQAHASTTPKLPATRSRKKDQFHDGDRIYRRTVMLTFLRNFNMRVWVAPSGVPPRSNQGPLGKREAPNDKHHKLPKRLDEFAVTLDEPGELTNVQLSGYRMLVKSHAPFPHRRLQHVS